MKKFLKTLISIAVSLTIYMTAANLFIAPGFAEETSSPQADEADAENSCGAAAVITIIAVFTATAAGTAVFTYKIRRKSSEKTRSDSDD